jgi:hypothetical protein
MHTSPVHSSCTHNHKVSKHHHHHHRTSYYFHPLQAEYKMKLTTNLLTSLVCLMTVNPIISVSSLATTTPVVATTTNMATNMMMVASSSEEVATLFFLGDKKCQSGKDKLGQCCIDTESKLKASIVNASSDVNSSTELLLCPGTILVTDDGGGPIYISGKAIDM